MSERAAQRRALTSDALKPSPQNHFSRNYGT